MRVGKLFSFVSAAGLAIIFPAKVIHSIPPASNQPRVIQVEGDIEGVHDPSIIKEGTSWYLFGTATESKRDGELPVRCSQDLHHWTRCGYVLSGIPRWIQRECPDAKELWAPDISYFDGQYHLYYAFSSYGKNSGIALLSNQTLDPNNSQFHWVDQGLVLRSNAEDDFNAIDPNLVLDQKGQAWLAFGSFWSGIKMRKLDRKSGKLSREDARLYSLARRKRPESPSPAPPGAAPGWQAVEAPFVVHHAGYYYLFVSFDLCCSGTESSYRTMVGRSRIVTGPYVDKLGKLMTEGGGSQLLAGNSRWVGPGGESIFIQNDRDIIVFHAYDAITGRPSLQISTVAWDDGWPSADLEANQKPVTSQP
ncbi:MAG: arabinan endo-1,5-alpha-L-arabinosidase [Terriglobales bacterium]